MRETRRRRGGHRPTGSWSGSSLALASLAALAACSTQPDTGPGSLPVPSMRPSLAPSGPGTYLGEALNSIGTPVDVTVTIGADLAAPVSPDAAAASTFLARSAGVLNLPTPSPRYLSVQIDNTGQVDAVPLPKNIDVLDATGRGANFRPAYERVRENQELLRPNSGSATAFAEAGAALAQRLMLREDLVRPGQIATIPYISNDPLADVARVIINGAPARRSG